MLESQLRYYRTMKAESSIYPASLSIERQCGHFSLEVRGIVNSLKRMCTCQALFQPYHWDYHVLP